MKLLLTSVFGPYAVDDEYGVKENKMELFHNQVTREEGIFSYRFNHRSRFALNASFRKTRQRRFQALQSRTRRTVMHQWRQVAVNPGTHAIWPIRTTQQFADFVDGRLADGSWR